jgi:hypothetical protein
MKNHILIAMVIYGLAVLVSACSHKKIMKDCKGLQDSFYECEEP